MHQAQDVEEALDANAPGTVEFTGYAAAAAAQDAVKHKQVYGASSSPRRQERPAALCRGERPFGDEYSRGHLPRGRSALGDDNAEQGRPLGVPGRHA
jgi:hypothetical protein